MAEFVEFRIEGTIPEVEEMERLGILSNKEVKKLIQKRRDFEYRLARRSKKKSDFINYINYEKKLIELIRIRRKQIGVYEKRHQIEASISRRVLKQARLLTRLWPAHLDTWALRISFSRFIGWKDEINGAYTEQVNFHGNCESVWIAWAKWEIEERRNFDKARAILLSKAPLYHPKSPLIKRELFRLELLYVEMLVNKVKHENIAGLEEVIAENREKVLKCAVAQAVYLDAVRTLPQPELYLQLYQVADKFEFARELRDEIYRDLCIKFPGAECLWKLKAQRLVSGLREVKTEPADTTNTSDRNENSEAGDENISPEVIVVKGKDTKDTTNETAENRKDSKMGTQEDHEQESEEEEEEGESDKEEEDKSDEEREEEDSGVEEEDEEVDEENRLEYENSDEEEEDEDEVEQEEEEDEMEESSDVEESEVKVEDEEDGEEEDKEEDEMEQDSDMEDKGEDDNSEDEKEEEEEEENNGGRVRKADELQNKESNSTGKDRRKNAGETTNSSSVETSTQDVKREGEVEDAKPAVFNPTAALPTPSGKLNPQGKLELVISVFDKAMEVIGAKFVNTYVDELLPLLHQCWGVPHMTTTIYNSLLKLFEQHTALLSPLHFYIWYQVLCQQPEDKHKAQAVLESGVRQHPAAAHLQLELARCIIKEADTDAPIMKEFRKVGSSMQGECGLIAWKEFAKHLCKDSNKLKVFKAAMDHEDYTVARGMRVLYLQDVGLQEGILGARKLYQKLKWRPPFCGRLQAQMVELELAQATVNAEAVREVFNISIQQHGSTNPGMWLAYIQFEKKHGDALKAGGILTRAEKELVAQQAHVFQELNLTIQELLRKGAAPVGRETSNTFFVEKSEDEESQSKDDTEPQPALASLFEEELTLSYTANNARNTFFSAVHSMERNIKKGNKAVPGEDGQEWEKVLELLLCHKISLSIQEVKVEAVHTEKNDKAAQKKLVKPRFKDKYEPTDQLNPGEGMNMKTVNDDDIEKILASSDVLKPDFMQKTCLTPYFVSKKKAKALRKKESVKTKGPGWFNMKAPELTEEAKRDLEVLQMRSVLDPKRHYKNDMKVLPKYFQLGEVKDSPVDFYSSRVSKKKRKRTMAEEIMHDEEALRYQKKKYNEIIAAREKKQFKHPNVLRKKKTKKMSTKK